MNGLNRPLDTTNGLKLLGERNSGTNLLERLLSQLDCVKLFPSLPMLRQEDMPLFARPWVAPLSYKAAHEATLDDWHLRDVSQTGGWKHAAPDQMFRDRFLANHRPAVLIITRHPSSWLRSMHRNAFHALNPVRRNFSRFIRQEWLCVGRDALPRRSLPDLPSLQAAKTAAYVDLCNIYDNSSLIRYEDLMRDPVATLSAIGLMLPADLSLPQGDPRGFARQSKTQGDYSAKAAAAGFGQLDDEDADFVRQSLAGSVLLDLYAT